MFLHKRSRINEVDNLLTTCNRPTTLTSSKKVVYTFHLDLGENILEVNNGKESDSMKKKNERQRNIRMYFV